MEHDESEVERLRAKVAALREETKRQQAVISLVNRKLDHCGITRAEIIRERDTARALLLRVGKWVPDTTDEFVDLRAFLRGDEACVCGETSARNCPVHQNAEEER